MLVLADAFGQISQQSRVSGRGGSTVPEQNPSRANGEMHSLETQGATLMAKYAVWTNGASHRIATH
jgi:hypothetical protein